ncbi:MAG: hypothetical protein Q4D91_07320 [Lautropia sp.]|nr:hypothetical protein [Lautropia sp.]
MDFPLSLPSFQHRPNARGAVLAVSAALLLGSLLTAPTVEAADAKAATVSAKKAVKPKTAKPKKAKKAAAATAAAAAAALVIPAADAQQMNALQAVMLGTSQCEFNQQIHLTESTEHPGYVDLAYKKQRWLMKPVVSSTGALRLEDVGSEALLIQIRNKSMVLNQRTGQRFVDGCIHPKQQALMSAN